MILGLTSAFLAAVCYGFGSVLQAMAASRSMLIRKAASVAGITTI